MRSRASFGESRPTVSQQMVEFNCLFTSPTQVAGQYPADPWRSVPPLLEGQGGCLSSYAKVALLVNSPASGRTLLGRLKN
jgi:hypothetical protein